MSDTRIFKLLPTVLAGLCLVLAGCHGGSSGPGTYTVGGTASGIASGKSLVLGNNGADIVTVSADGSFTFPTVLAYGQSYNITIVDNPVGEICSLGGIPKGIIGTSSINPVAAVCKTSTATVSTWAGFAGVSGSANGPGAGATFSFPVDVASDAAGNLYVSDSKNRTIRKIATDGTVTTLAGTPGVIGSTDAVGPAASFSLPTGLTVDGSGNVFVVDTGNNTIRKVAPDGTVTTVAGTTGASGTTDGTGTAAKFSTPASVAVDSAGNLFVTDRGNSTIRKITPAGVVSTFAGNTGASGSSDGTGAGALFRYPVGIAIDASNNLYVGDGLNTIRKITPAAVVTTLAGVAGASGNTDGAGAGATFNAIAGIALDTAGNIYVADQGNAVIRKVAPDGTVSMLAGITGELGHADGNGGAANFNNPTGVAVDAAGNVYVADYNNHTIRKIVQ